MSKEELSWEIISTTRNKIYQLLNPNSSTTWNAYPIDTSELENFIDNYDVYLSKEFIKQIKTLEHQNIKPDYNKIVTNIHRKFKAKYKLYLEIKLLQLEMNWKMCLLERIECQKLI